MQKYIALCENWINRLTCSEATKNGNPERNDTWNGMSLMTGSYKILECGIILMAIL